MKKLLPILILLPIILVACSSAAQGSDKEFPAFVYSSASSLEGYRIATRMTDTLARIPCYCGCGKANQHQNLKECFIKPDGGYDDHASGCNVCVKEAIDVNNWLGQGKKLAEVRKLIDEKYKDYGQPTDTPPVD